MPHAKIKLEKTALGHEAYRDLSFREPMFAEYMEIGEPFMYVPAGDGRWRRIDDMIAIRKYAEMLLLDGKGGPGEPEVLKQLNVRDARKVRDAIVDFFLEGEATDGSNTSPTNSSSTPGSTPEPSTASPSPA